MITAVGDTAEIRELAGPGTRVVALDGAQKIGAKILEPVEFLRSVDEG